MCRTLLQNFKKMHGLSIEKHLAFGYDLEKFYPELWHAHLVKIKELDLTYTAQMLQKGISLREVKKLLEELA